MKLSSMSSDVFAAVAQLAGVGDSSLPEGCLVVASSRGWVESLDGLAVVRGPCDVSWYFWDWKQQPKKPHLGQHLVDVFTGVSRMGRPGETW